MERPASPSQQLDALLALGFAPTLKAAGFRKKRRSWARSTERGVVVVEVQSSQWNAADDVRFTLNLGVSHPAVAALLTPDRTLDWPSSSECALSTRIGALLPGGRDTWWQLAPSIDRVALSEELVEVWRDYALPWLERVSDLEGARAALIARGHEVDLESVAAYDVALGDRAAAAGHLVAAIVGWPQRADWLRPWAMGLGISLEDVEPIGVSAPPVHEQAAVYPRQRVAAPPAVVVVSRPSWRAQVEQARRGDALDQLLAVRDLEDTLSAVGPEQNEALLELCLWILGSSQPGGSEERVMALGLLERRGLVAARGALAGLAGEEVRLLERALEAIEAGGCSCTVHKLGEDLGPTMRVEDYRAALTEEERARVSGRAEVWAGRCERCGLAFRRVVDGARVWWG